MIRMCIWRRITETNCVQVDYEISESKNFINAFKEM